MILRFFCLSLIYSCSLLSCEPIESEKCRLVFEIFVREVVTNPVLVRPMAQSLLKKNMLMNKKILLTYLRPAPQCAPIFPISFIASLYKEIAFIQAQNFSCVINKILNDPNTSKKLLLRHS